MAVNLMQQPAPERRRCPELVPNEWSASSRCCCCWLVRELSDPWLSRLDTAGAAGRVTERLTVTQPAGRAAAVQAGPESRPGRRACSGRW